MELTTINAPEPAAESAQISSLAESKAGFNDAGLADGQGIESQVANAIAEAQRRASERERQQKKKKYAAPVHQERTWLMDDPFQWRGRRVRNRRTGAIYTVRQIFRTGRVELEKSWMTYLSNVDTIRAEYEPCV